MAEKIGNCRVRCHMYIIMFTYVLGLKVMWWFWVMPGKETIWSNIGKIFISSYGAIPGEKSCLIGLSSTAASHTNSLLRWKGLLRFNFWGKTEIWFCIEGFERHLIELDANERWSNWVAQKRKDNRTYQKFSQRCWGVHWHRIWL